MVGSEGCMDHMESHVHEAFHRLGEGGNDSQETNNMAG